MFLAVVIGDVVATRKVNTLDGKKLMIIQPIDLITKKPNFKPVVAADTVGSGIGNIILYVDSREGSWPFLPVQVPCDAAIVGIVDTVDIESVPTEAMAEGKLMEIEE
jgi:microcompartment protein CcmK/EutM